MALHNTILFSAAYAGALQGIVQADIAPGAGALAQVLLFATAVDTAVPNDAAISAGGGAQAAAAFTTGGGAAKMALLQGLCAAAWKDRNPTGNPPASYTAEATLINTAYQAAVLVQTIP